MAFDELPPDPYKALGVSKDATLTEIRSAHRKLVLKCHPDKVQDAALKAVKQDEFQKVQQAYELLSDDSTRSQYDEQVKLYALRKEMGRGHATPRSNPFEYEVRTAEPRSTTFTYNRPSSKPSPRETTKVYPQQQRPSSYEDVAYESARHPKKSASYESEDRDRKAKSRAREEDRARDIRKHEEDERMRAKLEKESRRAAHGEKKKRSDKEKKRNSEEKYSSRAAYVEEDSSDDYRAGRERERVKDKARQERHRMEEEIRARNDAARAEAAREASRKTETSRQAPLTPKWDDHKEFAAQYMQAARRKAAPAPAAEDFRPRPLQRGATFAGPDMKYNVRYAAPPQAAAAYPSDDDAPRRSSASRPSRRVSEASPTPRATDAPKPSSKEKEREKDRDKERKKSGRSQSRTRDAYPHIIEPPSPPPIPKMPPTLQSHSSAPPIVPAYATRKEPSRSKTQDYPRSNDPGVPPLPRAATFQSGDRAADRGSRGSRLKKTVDYSSGSDSDAPAYASHRRSHSPPPSRRREPPEPTRYIIDNGRSVPITSRGPHRAEMQNIDDEVPYMPRDRDRSESPLGRLSMPRAGSSSFRQPPVRSSSQAYFSTNSAPPAAPEPVIRDARPKMPPRESGHGHSRSGGASAPGPYFEQVKYAAPYRPEDVIYNESYRRGSDPNQQHPARDYAYPTPLRSEYVHA